MKSRYIRYKEPLHTYEELQPTIWRADTYVQRTATYDMKSHNLHILFPEWGELYVVSDGEKTHGTDEHEGDDDRGGGV